MNLAMKFRMSESQRLDVHIVDQQYTYGKVLEGFLFTDLFFF
jgi:hypothetical protein